MPLPGARVEYLFSALPDLGWQAVVFCRVADVLFDEPAGFFVVALGLEDGGHIELWDLIVRRSQQRSLSDSLGTVDFSLLEEVRGE